MVKFKEKILSSVFSVHMSIEHWCTQIGKNQLKPKNKSIENKENMFSEYKKNYIK